MSVSVKAAGPASDRSLRKTPGTEVEVKLHVADRGAIVRKLRRLKATGGRRVYEMNTLYDTPSGELLRAGKLVRIRVERPAPLQGGTKTARAHRSGARVAMLTYKGPPRNGGGAAGADSERYKIREEHELRIDDADALARVFVGMGLRPAFRYEKYRTTYRLPGIAALIVELDETPIGDFLELEGDSTAIDRGAAKLGYRPSDYIAKSYGALFVERREAGGEPVGDMLFRTRQRLKP